MYVGRDFDPSDTGESERFTFDFVNDIQAGDQIIGATWTCEVSERSLLADAEAASRIAGTAIFSGTKTTQRVTGLQPGVVYVLRADVTTEKEDIVSLWSHVECKEPG